MANKKKEYNYSGPVCAFGHCICHKWESTTWADSEKKALTNLAFQYKSMCALSVTTKIDLDPKYLTEGGN